MKKSILFALLLVTAQLAMAQQPEIQYFRAWDQTGINVFEPSKSADQPEFTGVKVRIGGAFTQNYQYLTHKNAAKFAAATNGANKNLLYGVQKDAGLDTNQATLKGFNLAQANLNFDVQLGDGIRVSLENYMSARHHNEFWVKGGYIQIDKLPMFGNPEWYTKYVRVKVGHFQQNFGDMQFRRSDGGNGMYNPFVENFILDAFTTDIGGEAYVFPFDGFMGMIGVSSGLIKGNIDTYSETPTAPNVEPTERKPSVFLKLAYDKNINSNLRIRLSGSFVNNASSASNQMYSADRTGSQYFMVMEPAVSGTGAASTYAGNKDSGRFNPAMGNKIQAFMINPFVKFYGLEFFGSYEQLTGRTNAERDGTERQFTQLVGELVYRTLPREQLYFGTRYITMSGRPAGAAFTQDISISRLAFVAGWYPTENLALKGEFMIQDYTDFPDTDYRHEGNIKGVMVSAVVGF
ncbi:MAG: hypothetical protein JNL02_06105 [Saprospiraceae bacterium]|nr:hypothetical protein [Saprospiraceae bacterium]MCC7505928.1 hypothetical protein [Saprospiraceae bacterium]